MDNCGKSATGESVRIRRKHVKRLHANLDKISLFFGVKLVESDIGGDEGLSSPGDGCPSQYVQFQIVPLLKATSPERSQASETSSAELQVEKIQHYIDSVCKTEAEDSSYDSDCEADDTHEQVSRTTSDTLGQEFAEYVSCGQQQLQQQQPFQKQPGYTARVEFALKLGYTERLVQAALQRLGANPTQNELLAELIKLGAQQQCSSSSNKLNCDFICDSPQSECLAAGASSTGGSGGSLISSSLLYDSANLIDCHDAASSALSGQTSCGTAATSCGANNGLRAIVIDGSNVAMSHGNKQVFSCRGIKICVDWFKNRGHRDIVVFVPKWRKESCRPDNPIKDQEILNELERERMLVFTPSRFVGGKRMVCYDDRYILRLAVENDGIVVSNDNYRDLVQESCEFKKVVEERVLMYSFVSDRFMPPDDPLGRSGPTLDNFLRIQPKKGDLPPPCPYGKKCTYGNKCKFNHPERGSGPHKSISERLTEHAARHLSARNSALEGRTPVQGKSLSVPLNSSSSETSPISGGCESRRKQPLSRTRSNVTETPSNIGFSQQQQFSNPYIHCQGIPLCGWDSSHAVSSFPKAHSIENIPRENANFSIPSSPSQQHLSSSTTSNTSSGTTSSQFAQQQQQQQQQQLWNNRPEDPSLDGVNLHRKLQRQLTLNPAGCDPRIYQIQRGMCGMQQSQPPAQTQQQQGLTHRPLAPSLSGPRTHCPTQWDLHQNVTRIASAPDPSRPWHGGPPPASSSEPQIWPPQLTANQQQQQQQQQHHLQQDQRRRLHYHLASIFPEDQVQTVMQMYPEETNPQKICAAILNMYPKM